MQRKPNETIETYMLRCVLKAYDEIPRENFRSYLKALIKANDKLDNKYSEARDKKEDILRIKPHG
tara:strand:+ start:94 stop:288 length:195 start_codon:yes stop_codon:yes gene_type:complete